jgi:DNA repair exonuclease SbcCD ATPase subunit
VSADADRIRKLRERMTHYLLHGVGDASEEAVEGNILAEEARKVIDELTAELAEARRDLHEERSRADDYREAIERMKARADGLYKTFSDERAAHERTKAELAEARKQLDEAHWRLNDAAGALQDAGTPVAEERFDQAIQRLHAERAAAIAREQAATAEAPVLLDVLREEIEDWREQAVVDEGHGGERLEMAAFVLRQCANTMQSVVDKTHPDVRHRAARVPLWREAEQAYRRGDEIGALEVLAKLAALDEKGGA